MNLEDDKTNRTIWAIISAVLLGFFIFGIYKGNVLGGIAYLYVGFSVFGVIFFGFAVQI